MEKKDIITLLGMIIPALLTFIGTVYKLREHFNNKIHNLELQLKDLSAKDELQQQVIDQIGKQMDVLVPKLIDSLDERKVKPKKIKR